MLNVTTPKVSAELRRRFETARRVLVLTGAGVSAESGVPTFRGGGNSAVWKGLPFDVISSGAMLERNLPAVWEWFDYRRDVLRALEPNPAHHAIASWQERFAELTLVTQNVDGLHQRAGSRNVVELHGNIWRARCTVCRFVHEIPLEGKRPEACEECGNALRPDVVLFGEMLPAGAFEFALQQASRCELCFVIGTSGLVYPAASLPEVAKSSGAFICEVNPEPTPLSSLCDEVIAGKAGEVLPRIFTERHG
ncbi:MAG TPA: NAD-dependent deacylase [Pyrinomonadaceae bacterium]|nr:NAD-dependent deacylase [Pyrinomonadaceae bacterium]